MVLIPLWLVHHHPVPVAGMSSCDGKERGQSGDLSGGPRWPCTQSYQVKKPFLTVFWGIFDPSQNINLKPKLFLRFKLRMTWVQSMVEWGVLPWFFGGFEGFLTPIQKHWLKTLKFYCEDNHFQGEFLRFLAIFASKSAEFWGKSPDFSTRNIENLSHILI